MTRATIIRVMMMAGRRRRIGSGTNRSCTGRSTTGSVGMCSDRCAARSDDTTTTRTTMKCCRMTTDTSRTLSTGCTSSNKKETSRKYYHPLDMSVLEEMILIPLKHPNSSGNNVTDEANETSTAAADASITDAIATSTALASTSNASHTSHSTSSSPSSCSATNSGVPPSTTAPVTTNIDTGTSRITINDILHLLDINQYPMGSFTVVEFTWSRSFFYSFATHTPPTITTTTTTNTMQYNKEQQIRKRHHNYHNHKSDPHLMHHSDFSHPDRIRIGLQLYERLLQEMQYYGNNDDTSESTTTGKCAITEQQQEQQKIWICDFYQTIAPLLIEWKQMLKSSLMVKNQRIATKTKVKQSQTMHVISPSSASASASSSSTTTTTSSFDVPQPRTIIQTLKRCEGLYLLQSSPRKHFSNSCSHSSINNSESNSSDATTIMNERITESYYFWNNSVIVPILFEMILLHPPTSETHVNAIDGEKFIAYVQKRQRQLRNSYLVSSFSDNNNIESKKNVQTDNATSIELASSVLLDSVKETNGSSTNVPQLQQQQKYQFPNEAMCQQLLHSWVRWGIQHPCGSAGPTNKYQNNRMAIRHVKTLISKMIHQYNMTPSIQYYNGLLKLYAHSPSTSAVAMTLHSSKIPVTTKDSTEQLVPRRRVGSVYGREHRRKIQAILQTINNSTGKVQPTMETWYQTVLCYCNWNCLFDAQDIVFQRMVPMVSTVSTSLPDIRDSFGVDIVAFVSSEVDNKKCDRNHKSCDANNDLKSLASSSFNKLFDLACHHIVLGYRRLITAFTGEQSRSIRIDQKKEMLQHLTTFMESLQQLPRNTISHQGLEQIYGTFMDIYALDGNIVQLESYIEKIDSPNIVLYSLLMKAYGVHHCPDRGEQLLHILLKEHSSIHPTIDTVNALINAWAENPTLPNAPDRALAIIRYLDHNMKCIQLGIQPNTISFNIYLKCLAAKLALLQASSQVGMDPIGQHIENIITEMEECFKAGNQSVLPDAITYNVAIQCCANVGNEEGAQAILHRMRKSSIPPSIRTYNTILAMYAKIGTSESAKMAEDQILILQKMSKTNQSVKPDVFTFNHLFTAWAKSGDVQLYNRIWLLYKEMRSPAYDIQPDLFMYTYLISTMSRSSNANHLYCAEQILKEMEQNHYVNAKLCPDGRHYTPIITAYLAHINNCNYTKNEASTSGNINHENAHYIDMASQLFIRFMESHILGRTRYDAPKKELLHAIVKGYVKVQKLEECQKFLNNVASYSRNTRRYAYNIAPIQPDTKCYQELEKALMQSTGNQLRNNNADIDQKFKSCH